MKNATEAAHDGLILQVLKTRLRICASVSRRKSTQLSGTSRAEATPEMEANPTTTMSGMLTKGRTMATCRTTARMKNMNVRVTWNYRSMSTKIINMTMTRRATAYDVLEPK